MALAKALDLNPDLAEAHFARGLILWTKAKGFPHEQAILSFKKSLQLDANADEAHHQLSMVYSHVGLLDAAHEHVKTAVDINPNNTMARFRLGVYTAWQCRFEEALAVLKTVPSDVSPMLIDRVRAEVLVQMGRLDDAREIVSEYLSRHPSDEGGSFTSMNALLFAKDGKRRQAEQMIARAIAIGKGFGHFHHTAYNIASTYAALNKPGEAVQMAGSCLRRRLSVLSIFRKGSEPRAPSRSTTLHCADVGAATTVGTVQEDRRPAQRSSRSAPLSCVLASDAGCCRWSSSGPPTFACQSSGSLTLAHRSSGTLTIVAKHPTCTQVR